MKDRTLSAGGGRGVLVRAGREADCVQLALLSSYGNVMEAVTLERRQLAELVDELLGAQEEADRDLLTALSARRREAERRHREALARNPWLSGRLNRREDVSHET